jgi:hypothetical protein
MNNTQSVWLLLLFISQFGLAQVTTNNPYSSKGLGIWEEPIDAVTMGRGGARIANTDSTFANDYNPAALTSLAKGQPVFSFDLTGRFSTFETENASSGNRLFYLRSIQLAIPFANRHAIAFGMRPVFSRGYDFKDYQALGTDSVRHSYIGKGGVQQVYLSYAIAVLKKPKHALSLGLEGNYNYGNSTNRRVTEILSTTSHFNGIHDNNFQVGALSARLGLTYRWKISEQSAFNFGFVFKPELDWKVTQTENLYRFVGTYNLNDANAELIYTSGDNDGKVTIPMRWGAGLGYELIGRQDSLQRSMLLPRLRIFADLECMQWERYATNISGFSDSAQLNNTRHIRVGFDYTPHYRTLDRAANIKYFSKMSYRIGFNWSQLPAEQENINDLGITLGFGFPIPFNKSLSSLNFGMKFGQVGSTEPGQIRERYIGLHLGIQITPGFDRWFKKFKYD